MPEGRRREEEETVRERRTGLRSEVAVAGRELVGERVVVRDLHLCVVAHRAASGGVVRRVLVGLGEAVHLPVVELGV